MQYLDFIISNYGWKKRADTLTKCIKKDLVEEELAQAAQSRKDPLHQT